MKRFGQPSGSLLESSGYVKMLPGVYSALLIHMVGDSAAGVTRALADNGFWEIKGQQNGRKIPRSYFSWEMAYYEASLRGGLPKASSVVASTFEYWLRLPFSDRGLEDPNCLHVGSDDHIEVWWPDLDASADFDTCEVTILGEYGDDPQNYFPVYYEEDETLSGMKADFFSGDNLAWVLMMLDTGATEPDQIGITKAGVEDVDAQVAWDALVNWTNDRYRVESAALAVAFRSFVERSRNIYSALGKTSYIFDGGSGTMRYLGFGLETSPGSVVARTMETVRASNARVSSLFSAAQAKSDESDAAA